MKTFSALVLFCVVALAGLQTANAQSRPRRVGSTPPPQQQNQTEPSTPSQTDSQDSSEAARPTRPPVLGGANRDPNEQKPATPQKDAGPEEVGAGDVVKVDTTLVSIPVSVMDRDGKYIPNLRQENFRIWEDGVEQKVAYFASTEKPFTVALMLDTSGSMRFKMDEIQDAAIAFVNELRPEDKVMVISFDDRIHFWTQQPTNNRGEIQNAIRQLRQGEGTKLYDAVHQVMDRMRSIEGRKAIVLFTDGVDTTSKHSTYEGTVGEAEEADNLVYPVEFDTYSDMAGIWSGGGGRGRGYPGGGGGGYPNGRSSGGGILGDILGSIIFGGGGYPGGGYPGGGGRRGGGWPGSGGGAGNTREEYERGEQYLNDLARVTGARLYDAEKQDLHSAFALVAEELRRQYSLGYYPKNAPQAGERRNIKVRVDRPELVVRTRDSYIFQPGANTTAQSTSTQTKPPVLKKDLSGNVQNWMW